MIHPVSRTEVDEHAHVVVHPVFVMEPGETFNDEGEATNDDNEVVVLKAIVIEPAHFVPHHVMVLATGPRRLVTPIYRSLVAHANTALFAIEASSHPTARIAA